MNVGPQGHHPPPTGPYPGPYMTPFVPPPPPYPWVITEQRYKMVRNVTVIVVVITIAALWAQLFLDIFFVIFTEFIPIFLMFPLGIIAWVFLGNVRRTLSTDPTAPNMKIYRDLVTALILGSIFIGFAFINELEICIVEIIGLVLSFLYWGMMSMKYPVYLRERRVMPAVPYPYPHHHPQQQMPVQQAPAPQETFCKNCGAPVDGDICKRCGHLNR